MTNDELKERVKILEEEVAARDRLKTKIDETAKSLAEQVIGAKELAKITQNNIKANAAYYDSQAKLAEHFGSQAEVRKARSEQYLALLSQQEVAMGKSSDIMKDMAKEEKMSLDDFKTKFKENEDFKKQVLQKAIAKKKGMKLEELKELEEFHKKQMELDNENYNNSKTNMQNLIGGISQKVFGVSKGKYDASFLGQISQIGQRAKTKEGLISIKESLGEIFTVANMATVVFGLLVKNILSFAKAIDNASSSTAALVGHGTRNTAMMAKLSAENRINGISVEETNKAYQGLTTSFIAFNGLGASTRASMAKTASHLQKLGVDAGTSGELMAFFARNVGMSGKEAAKMTVNVAMMGKELNMNVSKLTKELNASLKTLAVYGDRAPQVFKGLAAAAQAAGVEVGELLNLAGKFDTFESAATTVGKLNALMGTQMNASSMLMMTEDQRIETLIQQVQAQGMAFKDMDRFTQKSLMMAAGITDINQAQKIFGMNIEQYSQYSKEQDLAASRQAELNEAMAKATPVLTKIKMLFAEFVISIEPVIDFISDMVTAIHKFIDQNRPLVQIIVKVIGAILALILVVKTFKFVFGGIGGILKFFKSGIKTMVDVLKSAGKVVSNTMKSIGTGIKGLSEGLGPALKNMGSAVADTVKSVVTKVSQGLGNLGKGISNFVSSASQGLGTFLTKMGEGIGKFVKGVSSGIASLAKALGTGFQAAMSGIGKGLTALGKAGPGAAKGIAIAAIGLAILTLAAIGLGFALKLGEGSIRAIADASVRLAEILLQFISENGFGGIAKLLFTIVGAMAAYSLMITFIAGGTLLFGLAIGVLAIALGGLALAFKLLPAPMLQAFAQMAQGLAQFDGARVETTFAAMTKFVGDLDSKKESVKPMLQNMALVTTGTSSESGAMSAIGGALAGMNKMIDKIGGAQQSMSIKLDGEATTKLMRGEAVKVQVGTNV